MPEIKEIESQPRPKRHYLDDSNKSKREPPFRLRVTLDLDLDLAYALGELILDTGTENTALIAIGHQLVGS